MNRTAVFSILMCGFLSANADAHHVYDKHIEHADKTLSWFSSVYDNPAMQSDKYTTSLNRICINYSDRQATTPQALEYGDKSRLYGGSIDAFQLKGKTTLWGHAGYVNGHVENIRYCETTDVDLLYPYIIADTVGGGTSKQEEYCFMGGFAYHIGKMIIGAQGQYKAKLDYRTRDPRPKNLTSDLTVNVGMGYPYKGYLLGLALGGRRYKQTNEVKFYDEVSVPISYHLTGLGTDYYRFRGSYTNTYYKGLGWRGSLNIKPIGASGFYGMLGYSYLSLEKIISDLNELPLSESDIYSQNMEAGYLHRGKTNSWGVKLIESYIEKRGIENIFGSPQDNIYPQIATEPQYKNRQLNIALEGLYQYRMENAVYDISLRQGYLHDKETYEQPYRLMKSAAVVSSVSLSALWKFKQWLLQTHAAVEYSWSCDNEMMISGSINHSMMTAVYHRYDYNSNNRYVANLGAEAHYRPTDKYSLFVAANWQYAHYMERSHTGYLDLSVGIEF